jgi:predicted transcriptional regulator
MNERNSLEDMMASFTNGIRKIVNRNKKYIINLAVAESVKYGANVYEFRLEDPNEHEEENERKQSQQIALPEEEITRVVTERLTGMSQQIRQLL